MESKIFYIGNELTETTTLDGFLFSTLTLSLFVYCAWLRCGGWFTLLAGRGVDQQGFFFSMRILLVFTDFRQCGYCLVYYMHLSIGSNQKYLRI